MFGRTYSMGWEPDLDEALIERPRQRLRDQSLRWAVWYPLRRSGSFEQLDEKEQRSVLAEHGSIGQSFGRAGIAHDVRLACHGLNKEDNDFIIGVLSARPASAFGNRAAHAQDAADLALHREAGAVLRWTALGTSRAGFPLMAPTAGGTRHAASSTPHAAGNDGSVAQGRKARAVGVPEGVQRSANNVHPGVAHAPGGPVPARIQAPAGEPLHAGPDHHAGACRADHPSAPCQRFDLDAAIIFCDILPPLSGMGLRIGFDPGSGPVIENPIASNRDIDMLAAPPATETLGSTLDAIRIVASELAPRGIPLVGFSRAPFTLASYAVEGGSSKSFAKTQAPHVPGAGRVGTVDAQAHHRSG